MTKNRAKKKKISSEQPTILDVLEAAVVIGKHLGIFKHIVAKDIAPKDQQSLPAPLVGIVKEVNPDDEKRGKSKGVKKLPCDPGLVCTFPNCFCQV